MEQTARLVTKGMNIGDVMELHPDAAAIMQEYGLQCLGCHVNLFESIEKGAKGHGMADAEIDKMVADVNRAISAAGETHAPPAPRTGDPLLITPAAAQMMKTVLEQNGKQGSGIRISAKPGGCSGFSYGMDLEDQKQDGDAVLDADGVAVYLDATSAEKLWGTTVDYVQTLNESGFKFQNPNATAGCGCGKSFR